MSADLLHQNAEVASSARSPKTRPHYSKASAQVIQLQRMIMEMTQTAKLKPGKLSGLARARCDVQEERRKLALRPLPKPVDVEKMKGRRARRRSCEPIGPSEPTQAS